MKHEQKRELAKSRIFEEAKQLFSVKGYANTTSKEICDAAKVNGAAINYYFGGKDELYLEVLKAARLNMLMNMETLDEIIQLKESPKEKLRRFLTVIIGSDGKEKQWAIRVCLLEMASPSPVLDELILISAVPKAQKLSLLIAQITGNQPGEVQQRATGFVLLLVLALNLFPPTAREKIFHQSQENSTEYIDTLTNFIYGGLSSLKRE